jgi:hypothetical protein
MRCERNPSAFNQEKWGNVMKKLVAVVWQVLTGGQNGGDARPHPNPLPRGEGGIVPRFLEDASNGMGRTVNRQTSDEPWSSPLLGERVKLPRPQERERVAAGRVRVVGNKTNPAVRADVPASHPFIFKPGMPLATTASILGASLILSCASVGRGALIAGWNFNSQAGTAPTPISADHGSGSLDLSHLANSSDATISSSGGTAVNKFGSDLAGNDLIVTAGTSLRENGKSIIFSFSTSGCQNIILTYATTASSTGFNSQQWRYGTDGINYTSFATVTGMGLTYTATGVETVDFSSATAVNNDATVYFELTLSGASGSGGTDHFDNFQFNATAVPEPPEWGAISALGLMGICGLREWRQRRCGEKLKSCPVK